METLEVKAGIDDILKKYPDAERDKLILILQEVQEAVGYISKEAIIRISEHLRLPASKIYGVATFYNQFRLSPIGKYHIQLCRGTACHVKGSKAVLDKILQYLKIDAGKTTRDGLFSVETVACIGACGLAPVIAINGKFYAKVTPDSVIKIIEELQKGV